MSGDLPAGWVEATLAQLTANPKHDIVSGPFGSNLKSDEYVDAGVPIIRLQNVDRNKFLEKNMRYITRQKARELSAHEFQAGDIVISKLGDPLGKACIVPESLPRGIVVADVVRMRIDESRFCKSYAVYAINSPAVISQINQEMKGSTRPRVNLNHLRDLVIPLAPLSEQKRIVAKVGKLLEKVDASRARLEKIPVLLKRFRQAVLAAACSGRLTADWREKKQNIGSAKVLLERLAKDREQKALQSPNKHRPIPAPIDNVDLPELPTDWEWATLDQIVDEGRPIIYGIIKPGPHDPKGIPYVRVVEMKDGEVAPLSELKRASPERAKKFSRATLLSGDLLISKDGTIGRVAIVPPELEGGNITQHLVRATVHRFLNREYIASAIRSQRSQNWLIGEKKGVALQGVNVEDFRRLPLPIPPSSEQAEIVRRVEELFALADRLEARVGKARGQVDKLTQSILAKAFRGELVPQDPNDEPAEKLLARIRATLGTDLIHHGKPNRRK